MAFSKTLLFSAIVCALSVGAAPVEEWTLVPRQGVTTLVSAQTISSFRPYTHYTAASKCAPASTLAWTCGPSCDANPHFKPVASGGDGASVQYWFVGFDPVLNTVILSRQGTDSEKIIPVLTNLNIIRPFMMDLQMFKNGASAAAVLAAVKKTMATYGTTSVGVAGHSLGGAISLLDAVFLKLNLPATTKFKTILYASPRVGNAAFASYVNGVNINVARLTNKRDPVPILPGRFLGFQHVGGEIHISSVNNAWNHCPGNENESKPQCTIGEVPNLFSFNVDDHRGPFDGIILSSDSCAQGARIAGYSDKLDTKAWGVLSKRAILEGREA